LEFRRVLFRSRHFAAQDHAGGGDQRAPARTGRKRVAVGQQDLHDQQQRQRRDDRRSAPVAATPLRERGGGGWRDETGQGAAHGGRLAPAAAAPDPVVLARDR